MEFIILNRLEAQRHSFKKPCAFLSINDPGTDTTELELNLFSQQHCKGYLKVEAHDVSIAVPSRPEIRIFDGTQALAISMFYHAVQCASGVETLYVCCEAAISRSSAIVAALLLYEGRKDEAASYFSSSSKYLPNKHIYDCMKLALAIKTDEL